MRYRWLVLSSLLLCALPGLTLAGQNIWTTSGPAPQNIPALVLDPTAPQTLYASAAPKTGASTLSKSSDGGGSWVQIANPLGTNTVSALAASGQVLYAGATTGVYKSVDGGGNWSQVLNPGSQQFRVLAINPLNTQIVYAGSSNGLYRSVDGGNNWTAISAGLPNANITALTITAAKPQRLYVGISGAGVYRSGDGGDTWAAVNTGLPVTYSMTAFAIDPQQPTTVYVGTGGMGVYKSADSGDTWVSASSGMVDKDTRALAIDPTDSQTLYVGTAKGTVGVSRSTDGGNTWAPFNSGLGSTSANALALGANTLHVATGAGVYSYSSGTPNNYPPVLSVPGAQAVDEGQLLSFAVNASDPDGPQVAITASGLPQGADFFDKGKGNGVFTWTPGGEQSGVYAVSFSATDGTFGDGPRSVKIAVDEVAQPGPEVVSIPVDPETGAAPAKLKFSQVTQAGRTTVRISSSGPALPPRGKAGTPHAVYDLHTEATYSGPVDLELDYEPAAFTRRAKVRLHHFEDNAWVDVTTQIDQVNKKIHGRVNSFSPFAVFEINNPPVLAIPAAQTIALGETLSLELSASDPDEGDVVSLAVSGLPGASLADQGNGTWTLTWTPAQAGAYSAVFTATDDDSPVLSVSQELSVTVSTTNQPPVAAAGPDQTVECAGPLTSIALSGAASSDPDGDALSYSWSENGTEVATAVSPILSLGRGSHTFTLTVTDGQGSTAVDEVVVNLVDTTPPTLSLNGTNPLLLELGTSYPEPGATASDLVDGNLSAHIQISGAVNTAVEGSYTITYSVSDAAGNSASASRTVQVVVTPNSYGLIATHSIHLRQNARITSGFAGVVNRGQAPFLAGKVELVVGTRVETAAQVRLSAPRVRVRQNADIDGELVYNQLVTLGKHAAIAQQTQVGPGYFPLFQGSGLPAFLTSTPGTQNIEVKQKASATLAPGAYNQITVKQKGTLTFPGGTYHLADLDVGPNADLRFLAPTVLLIRGQLALDQNSTFGPASGSGISAADILVYVEGRNGKLSAADDDDEGDDEEEDAEGRNLRKSPRAAKIGVRVSFQGNLYAPNGTIHLRQNSACVGSFIGRDVIVGVRVQVAAQSGWNIPGVIYQPQAPAPLAKAIGEQAAAVSPGQSALLANYPNPFNPSTTVPYVLGTVAQVKLSVYNVLGQQIRVLVDQLQVPGAYTVSWDGMDAAGLPVAGGVYFSRLEAGEQVQVKKMLFAK